MLASSSMGSSERLSYLPAGFQLHACLAQWHSNLSPAATFGALVAGQLSPGTMASAGPALRPAGQLLSISPHQMEDQLSQC